MLTLNQNPRLTHFSKQWREPRDQLRFAPLDTHTHTAFDMKHGKTSTEQVHN